MKELVTCHVCHGTGKTYRERFERICKRCGKQFTTFIHTKMYCGERKNKESCAFLFTREFAKEQYKIPEVRERMKKSAKLYKLKKKEEAQVKKARFGWEQEAIKQF